jgi:hypothetical protein
MPGSLAGKAIFDYAVGSGSPAIFAFAASASDRSRQARDRYADLRLPNQHTAVQWSILAAASLLVKGLEDSGRDLSAWKLVSSLSALKSWNEGFGPPVTWGPQRRIGSEAMHLMRIDPASGELIPVE